MKVHPILVTAVVLLASFGSLAQAAESENKTTSTAEDQSKLVEEGEDSFKYQCEGVAGYDVIYEGAHGRSWVNFVYDSEQTSLMDGILNAAGGSFGNKADDELIWRGVTQDGAFVPYACMFKMKASTEEGESVETIVVVQLAGAGSRVIGSVPTSEGMKAAEALADKEAKLE